MVEVRAVVPALLIVVALLGAVAGFTTGETTCLGQRERERARARERGGG